MSNESEVEISVKNNVVTVIHPSTAKKHNSKGVIPERKYEVKVSYEQKDLKLKNVEIPQFLTNKAEDDSIGQFRLFRIDYAQKYKLYRNFEQLDRLNTATLAGKNNIWKLEINAGSDDKSEDDDLKNDKLQLTAHQQKYPELHGVAINFRDYWILFNLDAVTIEHYFEDELRHSG